MRTKTSQDANSESLGPKNMHTEMIFALVLVAAVFTVYWSLSSHDFLHYDDLVYVTDNPYLEKGLSPEGIRWAFTTFYANFWHPLTWLSYLADYELYGLKPGGFLFTNLLLHLLSTLFLFDSLRRMTSAVWQSGLVALLFAIHPINVESVAWVAERKNTLSTLFWMLTLWLYGNYSVHSGLGRYFKVLACFILGLMSKPMLVTFPCVMLLLDYWPLGRMNAAKEKMGRTLARLILEKLPFLVIAIVFSIIAVKAQITGGTLTPLDRLPIKIRFANALVSYVLYLQKMIWPFDLAPFYPHSGMPPFERLAGAVIVLALLSFLALKKIKNRPWLAVGWLWYLGTLVPVLGLVQVGPFAMADRFAYIPLIGVFIMMAWSIFDIGNLRNKICIAFIGVPVLASLIIMARIQVGYWANSITLFERTLIVAGENTVAHTVLGVGFMDRKETEKAIFHFKQAVRLDPMDPESRVLLGLALSKEGKIGEAVLQLEEALRLDPSRKNTHSCLGNVLAYAGNLDEAIYHYKQALNIDPEIAETHNNLGVAYLRKGMFQNALSHFRKALEIKPGYVGAIKNLAKLKAASQDSPQKPSDQ